ncbi:MAG: hypothetical protein WCA89_13910 [Terracidiphilus sp.]
MPQKARLFRPVKRRETYLVLSFIGLLCLGLTGCAAKRLKIDFTGFERSYAETSNREMLLNLARLQNRDPTYFFKIGSITDSYKMIASLTGNASYALQSTNPNIGGPTGGGTPVATYENDPIFTFIPVNDETNAQLLLKPVPAETFYILYQQGWRADQLVRLMVDRIELTRVSAHSCTVETLRNVPPAVYLKADSTTDADYLRDPDMLSSYVTFLRINAVVYWLQKHGYLLLRGTNTFVPFDSNSGLDDNVTSAPKAQDIVTASQKSAVWEHVGAKWLLGEKVFTPVFSLYPLNFAGAKPVPDIAKIKRDILNDPDMKELQQGPALDAILMSLADGFSIEGNINQQDSCNSTSGTSKISAHLIMRSLMGLMAAAAQEQVPYDTLARTNPAIPNSRYLPPELQVQDLPKFMDAVPAIERIPLLRLTGMSGDQDIQPIVQVNYRGTNYRIADKKNPDVTDNQYWNRDVFRLINQLTSQVTVDISKFPLTEILQ